MDGWLSQVGMHQARGLPSKDDTRRCGQTNDDYETRFQQAPDEPVLYICISQILEFHIAVCR